MPDVLSTILAALAALLIIGPRRLPQALEALWLALTDYSNTQKGLPPVQSLELARRIWERQNSTVYGIIRFLYLVANHLEELRKRVLRALLVLAAAFLVTFYFAQPLLGLIIRPISMEGPLTPAASAPINEYILARDIQVTQQVPGPSGTLTQTITIPAGTPLPLTLPSPHPVFLHPTELFSTYLKISLLAAAGVSLPILLWEILMFFRGEKNPEAKLGSAAWEEKKRQLTADAAAAEQASKQAAALFSAAEGETKSARLALAAAERARNEAEQARVATETATGELQEALAAAEQDVSAPGDAGARVAGLRQALAEAEQKRGAADQALGAASRKAEEQRAAVSDAEGNSERLRESRETAERKAQGAARAITAAAEARANVYDGLTAAEMRPLYLLVPLAGLLFILGLLFTYFLVLPSALNFLFGLGGNLVQPLPALDDYIGFALSLFFWVGLSFELPLVMFFLARFGVVRSQQFLSYWRYAVVLITVIAAVITPTTDPFNMTLVALPMLLLYVVGIGLARLGEAGKRQAAPRPAEAK